MEAVRQKAATTATLGLLAFGLVRPLPAQPMTRVARAGDRVRVTTCEPQSPPCRSAAGVDGVLLAESGETLTVQVDALALRIPWATVRRLDRYEGRHGIVRSFALVFGGFIVGSVLGVATGLLVQGDCYEAGCLAGPVYGFLVGAPVGLVTGFAIDLTTRARWQTVYDGPVRVRVGPAGPYLHPGVGVGGELPLRW